MLMIRRVFGEENAVETTKRRPRRRCGCALGRAMVEQREVESTGRMLVVGGWIETLFPLFQEPELFTVVLLTQHLIYKGTGVHTVIHVWGP